MRIICDHCSLLIAGTVERLAGNLNLHPECLAQFGEEAKNGSTADVMCGQGVLDRHIARVDGKRTDHFTRDGE